MQQALSYLGSSYNNMEKPKRITIMMDADLDKLVRKLQAKKIIQTQGTYSFSKTINEIVRKGLKV